MSLSKYDYSPIENDKNKSCISYRNSDDRESGATNSPIKKRITAAAVQFPEQSVGVWKITKKLLYACLLIITLPSELFTKNDLFTIMIDPAGDAKHTGRLIQDTLERGISLQCAEELKKLLIQHYKNIRVVLTRIPGETIQPLQNASFANRLAIDLYLSIYFYQEESSPAYVTLYHYVENPIVDFWHIPTNLSFYSVNQAHLINLATTKRWGIEILHVLQDKKISKFFEPQGFFGIPFKPLLGIKAPAIAIEVGLKNKQDWHNIIEPLVQALGKIIS